MKFYFSNIMAVVMASVVSVSILASTQTSAATPPTEMEAWLKASKLGTYNKNENWSEIVANAKKEGDATRIAFLYFFLNPLRLCVFSACLPPQWSTRTRLEQKHRASWNQTFWAS